jgi:acyl dehydratase
MDNRYLDDLKPGDRFVSGGLTLTEAEIIDFAFRYDPQPFHLDANAAADSPYGGLIASGFQSIAVCFRLFIQSGIFAESSIGSPGLDELRWLARCARRHPEERRRGARRAPSQSSPTGASPGCSKAENQRGETVLSFIGNNMLKRRPAAAA